MLAPQVALAVVVEESIGPMRGRLVELEASVVLEVMAV